MRCTILAVLILSLLGINPTFALAMGAGGGGGTGAGGGGAGAGGSSGGTGGNGAAVNAKQHVVSPTAKADPLVVHGNPRAERPGRQ
jgi:hypothetical protein